MIFPWRFESELDIDWGGVFDQALPVVLYKPLVLFLDIIYPSIRFVSFFGDSTYLVPCVVTVCDASGVISNK